MSELPATSPALPTDHAETSRSLVTQVSDWLKLAGLAYAIGFTVILIHTARLNGPVVDAFQFQNILAGLPVWVLLCIGLWLWPRLTGSVTKDALAGIQHPYLATAIAAVFLIMSAALVRVEILFLIRAGGLLDFQPSTGINLILIFAVFTLLFGSIVGSALWNGRNLKQSSSLKSFTALFVLLTVYTGFITIVMSYAIYIYPIVPQSIGGGHPTQVRVYYKDQALMPLLGGFRSPGEEAQPSEPLVLYYRTASYLLVKSPKSPSLLQLPMEQVRAVIWLESH